MNPSISVVDALLLSQGFTIEIKPDGTKTIIWPEEKPLERR